MSRKKIVGKTSKGIIKDWYAPTFLTTKTPPNQRTFSSGEDLNDFLSLMKDPTVYNAIITTKNAILRHGFKIVDETTGKTAKHLMKKFEKLRFYKLLNGFIIQALLYGNAFMELVRDKKLNTVKELHLLETTEMQIETDPEGHGEVVGYWQNHNGNYVWFDPNEVWHFSTVNFTTNLWGWVNTKAIIDLVKTKKLIENYIQYLFAKNKFAKTWVIKNANTNQVDILIEGLKARRYDPLKEMVVEGEVDVLSQYTPSDIPQLTSYLKYIEGQIRQLLLLPPIVGGTQEGSNRSSAETQFKGVFGMNIKSYQKLLEEDINNDLFPKMGFKHYKLVFNPINKMDEREAIQNAIYLKGLGFNNKTIKEYLMSKGVGLPDTARFSLNNQASNIVKHEVQNKKSVSRFETPDNIMNREDKQKPINSQNTGVPLKTTGG